MPNPETGHPAVTLGPTRPWPLIQALFWSTEVAIGVAAVVAGLVFLAIGEEWYYGAFAAAAGALLMVSGAALTGLCWITALAGGPVVTLSDAGLRDIRISPATIPWTACNWGLFPGPRGSQSLQLDIAAPVPIRWPMRLLSLFAVMRGLPRYTILNLGTGKTPAELAALLHNFRAAKF